MSDSIMQTFTSLTLIEKFKYILSATYHHLCKDTNSFRVEVYNGNKGKTFLLGNTAILISTGTKKCLVHHCLHHFDVQYSSIGHTQKPCTIDLNFW